MTMELRIHTWPRSILRKKCRRVEVVDERIRDLLEDMVSLMRESKGIGLAANQAGTDLSVIVIEVGDSLFKLVNPRIIKKQGKMSFVEGCLSFPGIELKVKRAKKVWVSALNEKGETVKLEAEDLLAVVFQHEIDHINGISFIDRVSLWDKVRIRPLLKKIKS
jgi:peptide deformylase